MAPNTSKGRHVAQVEADIAGTVGKIDVSVGDRVQEGDVLVVLS